MGTLGCVPAYDRYFKSGLSLEGVGIQKYGNNSLIKVCEFYEKYNEELEVVRLNMNVAGLEYPQLKILDMGFWKIGFDADLSKGHSKLHQEEKTDIKYFMKIDVYQIKYFYIFKLIVFYCVLIKHYFLKNQEFFYIYYIIFKNKEDPWQH